MAKLQDLSVRHAAALERAHGHEAALGAHRSACRGSSRAVERGATLEECRKARSNVRVALERAQKCEARRRERSELERARARHVRLVELEEQRARLSQTAAGAVPPNVLDGLEAIEAAIAREQATLEAGGVRIEYRGRGGLTLNGNAMPEGEVTLTRETRIGLADGSELTVYPPPNLPGADARLSDARAHRSALLGDWKASSLAELRSRSRAARDAEVELEGLAAQIQTLTAADPTLGLAAGPEALKLFVAERLSPSGQRNGR